MRLEFPLSRFTVVVRPVLSVVFTVVRVVPLLLTRVSIVVPGVGVFVRVDAPLVRVEVLVVLVFVVVVLVFVVVAVVVPLVRVEVLGLSLVRLLLFSTSVRSCAALRTLMPDEAAVRVTRRSNELSGCCTP